MSLQPFLQAQLTLFEACGEEKMLRYHKWFLEHGTTFKEVDKKASYELAKKDFIKAKECYKNCILEAWRGTYYEGYVITDVGVPIEHCWLVVNDKVLDPTLGIVGKKLHSEMKRMGADRDFPACDEQDRFGLEYFGVPFELDEVIKMSMKRMVSGPFLLEKYLAYTGGKF